MSIINRLLNKVSDKFHRRFSESKRNNRSLIDAITDEFQKIRIVNYCKLCSYRRDSLQRCAPYA